MSVHRGKFVLIFIHFLIIILNPISSKIWASSIQKFPQESLQPGETANFLRDALSKQGLRTQVQIVSITKDDADELKREGILPGVTDPKMGWITVGSFAALGGVLGSVWGQTAGETQICAQLADASHYLNQITVKISVNNNGVVIYRVKKWWLKDPNSSSRPLEFAVPSTPIQREVIRSVTPRVFPSSPVMIPYVRHVYGTNFMGGTTTTPVTMEVNAQEVIVTEILRKNGIPMAIPNWTLSEAGPTAVFEEARRAIQFTSNREIEGNILEAFGWTVNRLPSELPKMGPVEAIQLLPEETILSNVKYGLSRARFRGGFKGGTIGMIIGVIFGDALFSLYKEMTEPHSQSVSTNDLVKTSQSYILQLKRLQNGNGLMPAHIPFQPPTVLTHFVEQVKESVMDRFSEHEGPLLVKIIRVEN